ncbi:MAG: MFS transporter, partial [Pedobacter sp.]
GLMLALFLLYFSSHAVQSNWSFYTAEKFNWTASDIGFSLGFVGLVVGLVQGLLIRYINPKIGEKNSVYVGLSLYVAGFVLFGLATSGWMMYAFMIPYGLAGIAGPAMQAIISKEVPANSQGEMQGLLTGIMSLAAIFGPWAMLSLFSRFIDPEKGYYFPGAPFILAALLTAIALIISIRTLKKYH